MNDIELHIIMDGVVIHTVYNPALIPMVGSHIEAPCTLVTLSNHPTIKELYVYKVITGYPEGDSKTTIVQCECTVLE